jgi:signal peptidase I
VRCAYIKKVNKHKTIYCVNRYIHTILSYHFFEIYSYIFESITHMNNPKVLLKEIASYIVLAIVIVIPIRTFVAQPFVVNGSSMDTTFADGEYLIVNEFSYQFNNPQYGDVVIFKYPLDPKKYFIKRLIGKPGDTVIIKDEKVTVVNTTHPEGITLTEPYIHTDTLGNVSTTLKQDEYFVLGDNRIASSDSRYWGVVPRKNIVGTPFVRLLPPSRASFKPGASPNTFSALIQ